MIITIDGPAGTGKTTVAKRIAEKLGFLYFDTGAMYRAIAYRLMQENILLSDQEQLSNFLKKFQFKIQKVGDVKRYFVDGEDVTEVIRQPNITQYASEVSVHPAIRHTLVSLQQEYGQKGNSVFEGRDMGTTVFPAADVKIFLTARPAVRAERRYLEMKDKIKNSTQEEVMRELTARDHLDSTREISPLKQADDAFLIDTSDLTLDEVVDRVLILIGQKKKFSH